MKVKSISADGRADVYNMEVKDTHDFAVNGGVIVHNCDEWRYLCMSRPVKPMMPVKEDNKIYIDPLNMMSNRRR